MKYLLKQNKEDKRIFCDKVTIDGFHYYVSDGNIGNEYYYHINLKQILHRNNSHIDYLASKKVIATNNPNIDIPKVVVDIDIIASNEFPDDGWGRVIFSEGYKKSQETHPFSGEDMVAFAEFTTKNLMNHCDNKGMYLGTKKVFQIWEKQQPKVIYYQ